MRRFLALSCIIYLSFSASATAKVKVKSAMPQTEYAAALLTGHEGRFNVTIDTLGMGPAEGFTIERKGKNAERVISELMFERV